MIKMGREEVELKHEVRSLNVNFSTLFRTGLDFLISCQDRNADVNKMDKAQMEAMFLLNNYIQNIVEEEEEVSPGGKMVTEVKRTAIGTSEGALAQTIVFSLLQRQRHPNSRNCMVPNILVSPDYVQIIMYDAVNDILLCSNFIDLFNVNADGRLSPEAVVILWLGLHYRIFGCGLVFEDTVEADIFKSNFQNLAREKWNIFCVPEFPVIEKGFKVETWNRRVLQGTEYCKGMKKRTLNTIT